MEIVTPHRSYVYSYLPPPKILHITLQLALVVAGLGLLFAYRRQSNLKKCLIIMGIATGSYAITKIHDTIKKKKAFEIQSKNSETQNQYCLFNQPDEILKEIGKNLEQPEDLHHFILTCKKFKTVTEKHFYFSNLRFLKLIKYSDKLLKENGNIIVGRANNKFLTCTVKENQTDYQLWDLSNGKQQPVTPTWGTLNKLKNPQSLIFGKHLVGGDQGFLFIDSEPVQAVPLVLSTLGFLSYSQESNHIVLQMPEGARLLYRQGTIIDQYSIWSCKLDQNDQKFLLKPHLTCEFFGSIIVNNEPMILYRESKMIGVYKATKTKFDLCFRLDASNLLSGFACPICTRKYNGLATMFKEKISIWNSEDLKPGKINSPSCVLQPPSPWKWIHMTAIELPEGVPLLISCRGHPNISDDTSYKTSTFLELWNPITGAPVRTIKTHIVPESLESFIFRNKFFILLASEEEKEIVTLPLLP